MKPPPRLRRALLPLFAGIALLAFGAPCSDAAVESSGSASTTAILETVTGIPID